MYFIVYVHFVGLPNNVCCLGVWRWSRTMKERLKRETQIACTKEWWSGCRNNPPCLHFRYSFTTCLDELEVTTRSLDNCCNLQVKNWAQYHLIATQECYPLYRNFRFSSPPHYYYYYCYYYYHHHQSSWIVQSLSWKLACYLLTW